jgi:serine/threonine protein kinase
VSEASEDDSKPKQFGRYLILEKLATGGMAQIFKARTAQSRIFTLKKILSDYSENSDFIKMFLEEAKISLSLKHPHIVRVIDFGQIEGSYYLAMEYVFGRDVGALLRTCAESRVFIPVEVACFIIMQCARGLDYAHSLTDSFGKSLGIVHRDISPPNILISYNGDAKILDFGIAKAVRSTSRTTTKSGVLKGKFSYMSPEQARGEPVDHQSDIFSLGIVFHELLTSRSLFYLEDDIATLENVRKANIAPPSKTRKDLPAALDKIVLKALAPKKKNRFQTGAEFAEAIRKFLKEYYPRSDARAVAKFSRSCFHEDYYKRQRASITEGWKDILAVGGADEEILLDRSFSASDNIATRPPSAHDEIRWYQRLLYDPKTSQTFKRRVYRIILLIFLLGSIFTFYQSDIYFRALAFVKTLSPSLKSDTSASSSAPSSAPETLPVTAAPKGSFLDLVNRGKEAENREDIDLAINFYNQALQINAFEQSILVRKNFMLLARGESDTACPWFQKHIEIEMADRLLAQAACLEIQGEIQKASATYSEFLEKFSQDERATKVRWVLTALKDKWKL